MDENRTIWWWVLGVVVLAAAGAAWWWWQGRPAPAPRPVAQSAPAAASAASEPAKAAPSRIEHPIEQAPAATAPAQQAEPLPPLAESDSALRAAISKLVGEKSLVDFFQMRDLASRLVATVDNLPRPKVAQKVLPVRGPAGAFVVDGEGDERVIGAENAARYASHLRLLEAVDTKQAAVLYLHFYPLLQQAYRDLGYPQGHFNDRLVAVIDHLLATPEIEAPIKLVQPKVLYEFADPALEASSAGQKLLLRMGAANATHVKNKLRAFRREITASPPQ
jgi:hypothetical protein